MPDRTSATVAGSGIERPGAARRRAAGISSLERRRPPDAKTLARADELHALAALDVARNTDKIFSRLLVAQWIAGVLAALLLTPYTWVGAEKSLHLHVLAAVFLGGLITLFPAVLAMVRPGWIVTRYVVACAQMSFGALLIHLTGGSIESHFHIFGSLAFLAFYWDWTVLIPATLVVLVDHVLRGLYFPMSIFGVLSASPWRIVEHVWWVLFEDGFLIYSCIQCQKVLSTVALQRAELEAASLRIETLGRHRTARAERKFKDIFETMEDGYIEAVWNGATTMVNPAAVRLFGYRDAAELKAVSARDLLAEKPDDSELTTLLEGGDQTWSRRASVRLKDGSVRIFEGDIRVVARGESGPYTICVMFRDITDRLRVDEEAQARLSADAANRLKSEFLAHMSHEIRTPMHAVLGLTNLALQTELTDRQRDYLSKIQDSGRNLLHIVNDILDFSKVEAGKLELEQAHFQLGEVMDSLVSTMSGKVADKGLQLLISVAPEVPNDLLGDPTRLGQVLLNLVSNAVKFTERGEVVVTVTREREADDRLALRFVVKDTGVGIEADVMPLLFQAFSQADTSITRKFGGTGLGLAICQRLVHLMHGELEIQSSPGLGSTFAFTAFFGTAEALESLSVPEVAGLKALIVDDNPIARSVLAGSLRRLGLTVTEESSCELALGEVERREQSYRVIFIEHQVRGRLSALELVRRLRRYPRAEVQKALIVLIGKQGDRGLADRASAAGVSSILLKPFTISHLVDTLLSLVGRPENHRSRRVIVQTDGLQEAAAAVRGARVLVVEDNPINQQIACELLSNAGLKVDMVSNGQEAVDAILSCESLLACPWDLVLMDLQMPVMDGYTAAAAIRRDARFVNLPIVAMTAHVLAEERDRCFEAGMNDCVFKPINPETLFSTIRRWAPAREPDVEVALAAEPVAVTQMFPDIVGVDTRQGLLRVAGNANLYRSLLLDVARQQQATIAEIETAARMDDTAQVRHLAHTLKGVAGNLGLRRVEESASELERLARENGDFRSCLDVLAGRLQTVSARILDALHQQAQLLDSERVGSPSQPSKVPLEERPGEIEAVLFPLAGQLESSDGAALESLPGALKALSGLASEAEIESFSAMVRQYDFEKALVELRRLTTKSAERVL